MTDKPPYVHEEWRGGRLIRRRYWRRMDGKPFTRPLPSDRPFTHPTFISAYESARRDFEALSSGSTKPAKGSVDAFVSRYVGSKVFKELARNTQNARRNNLRRFCEMRAPTGKRVGGLQLRAMELRHLRVILADMTPDTKRVMAQAIRAMIESAVERGEMAENVAKDFVVRLPKTKGRRAGRHTWTAAEIASYRAHHAPGSRARLALDIGLLTGQRIGDAVRIGWGDVDRMILTFDQQKTGATARIPVKDELFEVVRDLPHGLPWIRTGAGAPWASAESFRNQFRSWCAAAGLDPRCTYHGLRKAFCCHWAQAGVSAHQIATMSGHISLSEVERYTKDADREMIARAMLEG